MTSPELSPPRSKKGSSGATESPNLRFPDPLSFAASATAVHAADETVGGASLLGYSELAAAGDGKESSSPRELAKERRSATAVERRAAKQARRRARAEEKVLSRAAQAAAVTQASAELGPDLVEEPEWESELIGEPEPVV